MTFLYYFTGGGVSFNVFGTPVVRKEKCTYVANKVFTLVNKK